ncbi:cellulase family glycosylhydrolase [Streptomyces sp. NPDC101393]|uniref:cellulase family glycosylhydrolase n=1 Tax=Streptomyces sp. NPDC101393 TaxID=3366141 RepID=UPI00380D809C
MIKEKRPGHRAKRTPIVLTAVLGVVTAMVGSTSARATDIHHSLDYEWQPGFSKITVGDKTVVQNTGSGTATAKDKVFRDGTGREVSLRGWNTSGETKIAEAGFIPFKTTADAAAAFQQMRNLSGTNVVRFLISWEGVNPQPGVIDHAYLDKVAAQIKEATSRGLYVLLDWHQDLYSRHLWQKNSWYTGNGAPKWAVPSGEEYCGVVCAHWAQNLQTNDLIRSAYRSFWKNTPIKDLGGPAGFPPAGTPPEQTRVQDAFLWQMSQALQYLSPQLHAEDRDHFLGVDPFNEPADGGVAGKHWSKFDNDYLWPFYKRVRKVMDDTGFSTTQTFAEPLVFWNSQAGNFAPATGGHHLKEKPGPGFVFNSHFYDSGRMGPNPDGVDNNTYLPQLQDVRSEARYLGMPMFLSEYGMWLNGIGAKDTDRIIKATYQGMEQSDQFKTVNGQNRIDPYTPLISGTQWHWDIYHDKHHETMNGNPDKVITKGDAWNDENFSVVNKGSGPVSFTIDPSNAERVYPRAVQGDLMNFTYNDMAKDGWKTPLNWYGLAPQGTGDHYFQDKKFALVTWRSRHSSAPTEIYLPPGFDPSSTAVVTEKTTQFGFGAQGQSTPKSTPDEVMFTQDSGSDSSTARGNRLMVWDDPETGETDDSWHYAVVVADPSSGDRAQLPRIQAQLNQAILKDHKNPVELLGKLDH